LLVEQLSDLRIASISPECQNGDLKTELLALEVAIFQKQTEMSSLQADDHKAELPLKSEELLSLQTEGRSKPQRIASLGHILSKTEIELSVLQGEIDSQFSQIS
jgi:hypothetical protein